MWEVLMGYLIGDAIGKSPLGRLARPLLMLFILGVLIAGLIYGCVVFKAVYERSQDHHAHKHRAR
jgi:hypothetical protein